MESCREPFDENKEDIENRIKNISSCLGIKDLEMELVGSRSRESCRTDSDIDVEILVDEEELPKDKPPQICREILSDTLKNALYLENKDEIEYKGRKLDLDIAGVSPEWKKKE